MSIQIFAKCDGPGCDFEALVKDNAWPNDFTIIKVIQQRHQLPKHSPIGEYGFHSKDCIIRWASGHV